MDRRTLLATGGLVFTTLVSGCGESQSSQEPTPEETTAKKLEVFTSESTETPTSTEEAALSVEEEIETRLNAFVYDVLDVKKAGEEDTWTIQYHSAGTAEEEIMAEIAKVAGTMTYLVDHGKVEIDWFCGVYLNVEGEYRLLGDYWIFKSDVEAYIIGNINEDELYRRAIATWQSTE